MGDIAKDINSKFPNERVKALINIKYTANWLNNIGNALLKPHEISLQQYNILRILKGAKKEMAVNAVRERMIEKSPNATRLMDKLCNKKLIERMRCHQDRRIVYIKITNLGLQVLERVNIQDFDYQMQSITENEAKTLNYLLDKLR